jgi:hypothetical protein
VSNKYLDSWDAFEANQNGLGPQDSRDLPFNPREYDNTVPFTTKFERDAKKGKKGGNKFSKNYDYYYTSGPRCYSKHPPLKIPGTDKVIYGGSCSTPAVHDADVYIGFAGDMRFTERNWPWKKGSEVLFRIPDMCAPEKPEEFKKLVNWTIKQLEAGLKVHCGCMGGHGRTGMFMSAIVAQMGGVKDATEYVRKNYCSKAVESNSQVEFLHKEYGITKHLGYKTMKEYTSQFKGSTSLTVTGGTRASGIAPPGDKGGGVVSSYGPMPAKTCIWNAIPIHTLPL